MDGRLVRGRRSREEILDAASRLMSQRGYDGTTISTISKESGLPTGSIYHHFNSKAEILAGVMERGAQQFFDSAGFTMPTSTDPQERLRHALKAAHLALEGNEEFLRLFILLLLSNENDHSAEVVQRVRERGRQGLYEIIRASFQPQGEDIAIRVADQLVVLALATFDGIFIAVQANRKIDYDSVFEQMAISLSLLGSELVKRR
jgi:AcrR family transcriptional regulator